MDTPLGFAAGNALEVLESVETLRGAGPADLEELVCIQGGILLHATGLCEDADEGAYKIHDSLIDGSAISIFEQMCIAQGVAKNTFDSERNLLSTLGLLDPHLRTTEISVPRPGWIADIDAMGLGKVVLELGGGRLNLGEEIDPGVGFVLDAHVGSLMVVDETWITIYHRNELSQEHRKIIENAITLSNEPVDAESRVIEIL
jgi:thymidine phosphorylase